ncbi:putative Histone deacetylase complex subunit SAP18 [Hypsibius exemplaris]|uniref:18 kDa Sin3-associated polypeptide n=1 Tax=Hypsibius exemplaris TaxID=2072580 RepID=A0A1W0X4I6_HYPEX|nr:putative Histone deacetylase complex subunit SAP18 [Hypsibius exemplaris]
MKLYVHMTDMERAPLQIRSTGRGFEREILQVRIPGDTMNRGGPRGEGRGGGGGGGGEEGSFSIKNGQQPRPAEHLSPEKPLELPSPLNTITVDREKTCPLLLRVFPNLGRHHNILQFSNGNTPAGELQIYTWMDASLKELSGLIRDVQSEARLRDTIFEFSLVFPDPHSSMYRSRSIGTTLSGTKGKDDNKCLYDVNFKIGNYLTVAITPPDDHHSFPN